MKTKHLGVYSALFAAASLLFAACTADELATAGDSSTSPLPGEAVASGTVKFGNNTTLTIGDGGTLTRGVGTVATLTENQAAKITIPETPTYDEGKAKVYTEDKENIKFYSDYNRDIVIRNGATVTIESPASNVCGRAFIENGTLKLGPNSRSSNLSGFVVLEGGTLDLTELEAFSCENAPVYMLGGTVKWPKKSIGGKVYTEGDLYIPDLEIENTVGMYIGGNLTCKNTDYSVIYGTPKGCIYVGGDLRTESIHFINGQHIFVGGSLYVDRSLEMESHCVVTVGCKIVAEKIGANGGDTYIESTYIKADTTFLGSSGSIDPAVCLPDGGVADLGHLSIGGTNTFFHVPSDDATALVNCDECYLTNILDVSQAIDGHFYFNYGKLSSHAEGQITIADSSKVNVATINEEWAEECNPGFTVGGGDTPGSGDEGGEDIVIDIESGILDDYTVAADDFAIRINSVYDESIQAVGGNGNATATLGNIKIEADQLKISLSGLNDANILPGNDYTYEVTIWVNNVKPASDGSGSYVELFDDAMKEAWVGGQPGTDGDPYGEDVSRDFVKVASPAGYAVRYNVYRGVSGSPNAPQANQGLATTLGDTPYIKVSIHVQKDDKAQANSATPIYPGIR